MTEPNKKYRSVFISDVHLGSRVSQSELLCDFLKNNSCDTLYLVGDIVDFWKLERTIFWPQSHSNVIRRILTASKRDTKVKYVIGNHDEQLRSWFHDTSFLFGNIEIANQFEHYTVCKKRILVTHGDLFDNVIRYHKWLSILGDKAYSGLIFANSAINKIRKIFGRGHWSFSNYIKINTKQAVSFITKFEDSLIAYAKAEDYDGVICGHIHTPAMKCEYDFLYLNTGDWCETVSAIVEHHDGTLEVLVLDPVSNQLKPKWSTVES